MTKPTDDDIERAETWLNSPRDSWHMPGNLAIYANLVTAAKDRRIKELEDLLREMTIAIGMAIPQAQLEFMDYERRISDLEDEIAAGAGGKP